MLHSQNYVTAPTFPMYLQVQYIFRTCRSVHLHTFNWINQLYAAIILQEPCVLYIGRAYRYPPDVAFFVFLSTNISTGYFKHAARSPFFSSKCHLFHNATFLGSCIMHVLHANVKLGCQKVNYRFTVCRLDTARHVTGIPMPIIRSLSTTAAAAAASGLP
jgi:hypothetical protein